MKCLHRRRCFRERSRQRRGPHASSKLRRCDPLPWEGAFAAGCSLDRNGCGFFVLTFDGLDDLDGGKDGSEEQAAELSDELDLVGELSSFQLVHFETPYVW